MNNNISHESFFLKRIPLLWLFIVALASGGFCYYLISNTKPEVKLISEANECPTYMKQVRLSDFKLTHPLLLTDVDMEDSRLQSLKNEMSSFIDSKKADGTLITASVYCRRLNDGGWISINPFESYTPASLQKVTIMMAYLKEVERNHPLLDKKLYFNTHFDNLPKQNIKVFSLKEHQYYTIKDLLHYMIAYSDNDALNILYQNMNNNTYAKLWTDIQLTPPNLEEDTYTVNVKDFAKFFRMLFSSTYYSDASLSEYALKLLTQSTYKEGITKNFDSTIVVAHKFGERVVGASKQLHEFGIIYPSQGSPYLLGIMTKGNDFEKLRTVLTAISDMTYSELNPVKTGPTGGSSSVIAEANISK